jgi:hypothetical protein
LRCILLDGSEKVQTYFMFGIRATEAAVSADKQQHLVDYNFPAFKM